jgi:hypothetical protein
MFVVLRIRRMLMSEDHRANRKDRRANPNDYGGFLLGYDWRRFHDQITATRSLGFLRSSVKFRRLGGGSPYSSARLAASSRQAKAFKSSTLNTS